ncbi:MAG: glycosyltransferase [Zhenhengia sp.]|uniref:glycosyltransferase n=1 Tax=Zhenhengia sp. TaxID=2944208 RepID=UPI0039958E38
MKIAIVFDGLGIGGIEKVGISYIKMLIDAGYEIDVYNLNPKQNEMEEELKNICRIIKYGLNSKMCPEIYSYGVKRWWWGKYIYPIAYILMWGLINILKIVGKNRNKKYDIAIAFSGHINDLTFIAENFINADKKLCWAHGAVAEYLLITFGYGNLYNKIKNVCVLSNYAQESAMLGNKFLKNLNIKKIYNPIDITNTNIDNIIVQDLQNKYGEFLLMVGRFSTQKDQGTVVKAFSILKKRYNVNKKLVFVGDGETRKHVESIARKLDIIQDVVFEGNRKDVQNYYKASYLFIHSSPAEGLPTVILEAMCYAKPIIATDSLPGVREILGNDEYGLVCKVGDSQDMANKIFRLLLNKEDYDYYSKKSTERVSEFSSQKILAELENIINKI